MNVFFAHNSTLVRLYWAGTTWASEMNFVMHHAPDAGSIARPVYWAGTTWANEMNFVMHHATDVGSIT